MSETLHKKVVGIAQKHADLLGETMSAVTADRDIVLSNMEPGGTLHQISDGIRALNRSIIMVKKSRPHNSEEMKPMYEVLHKKVVSIAEKYADMLDEQIVAVAASRENFLGHMLPGGALHEISDGIGILHHAIVLVERLNRKDAGTSDAAQSNKN